MCVTVFWSWGRSYCVVPSYPLLPTKNQPQAQINSIGKGGITSESCSLTYLLSSDTELDVWFGKGFNTSYLSSLVMVKSKSWENKTLRILMCSESKGQHGYFTFLFVSFFLVGFWLVGWVFWPCLYFFLPILSYHHLLAFPRRHLVVHKVIIAALTNTTSPCSPVCLAVVLPWEG